MVNENAAKIPERSLHLATDALGTIARVAPREP
jgi:hypothetical protein